MRTAVRCGTCGVDAAGSARWCGRCGTPLDSPDGGGRRTDAPARPVLDEDLVDLAEPPPPPLRSRLLALGAVVAVLGGLVAVQASRQTVAEARGMTPRGDAARDGVASVAAIPPPTGEAWSSRLAFPSLVAPTLLVLPADRVVYVVDLARTGGVSGHDPDTGALLWTRRDLGTANVAPVVAGDVLLLQEVGQRIVAIGPDGGTRWRDGRRLGSGTVRGDDLLEVTGGVLISTDAATGTENWVLDVRGELGAEPASVLPGGPDGQVLLLATTPTGIQLGAAPQIEEPLVAVLDAENRSLIRTIPLPPHLAWAQQPVAVEDDLLVYADVTDVVFHHLGSGHEISRQPHRLGNRPLSVHAAGGHALLLDGSGTLVAVDPSGTWVWSQTAPLPVEVSLRDDVVLMASATRVTAVDAATGTVRGGQPVPIDARRGPAGPDGAAYTVREDGDLTRYDVDGSVAWRTPLSLGEVAAPAAAPDGRVITATGDGVSVHRAEDGSRLWAYRTGRLDALVADEIVAPVVTEELVVVAPPTTQSGTVGGLYALRLETGILHWNRLEDRPPPRGPLTLDRDLVLLPVGSELHGYDPETGRRALAARAGDLRGPAAAAGGVVVSTTPISASGGSRGRTIRATTRADRTERWEVAADPCSAPSIVDDLVVVGTADGLLALDLLTGTERWRRELEPVCLDVTASVGHDQVIAITGDRLVTVERLTGEVVREVRLPAPAAASPVVIGPEIVVPLLDGSLAAWSTTSGDATWSLDLSGVPASSPVVVDGHLLLILRDGRLVALR